MRSRKSPKLAPDFTDMLAQAEISIAQLTRESKVSETIVYHLLNPSLHPEHKGRRSAQLPGNSPMSLRG